eukprot:1161921-Pelagomonas_calceolata.AAC.14
MVHLPFEGCNSAIRPAGSQGTTCSECRHSRSCMMGHKGHGACPQGRNGTTCSPATAGITLEERRNRDPKKLGWQKTGGSTAQASSQRMRTSRKEVAGADRHCELWGINSLLSLHAASS